VYKRQIYAISKIDLVPPKTLSNTIELVKAKTGETPRAVKANDPESVRKVLEEIVNSYLKE
jgi:ribosome biogenesis GTPase A